MVLEKKGLHQSAGTLENYRIDCETDVSLLDRDDFSKLSSNGLKSMEGNKLERWCNVVRARAENMLTSSLNTPAGSALPSSEALNVLTLPAYSVTMAECVSDNDSERDGEEDDNVSKSKIMLTEEEEKFSEQFQPVESKIDKPRKMVLRHVSDRGVSMQ